MDDGDTITRTHDSWTMDDAIGVAATTTSAHSTIAKDGEDDGEDGDDGPAQMPTTAMIDTHTVMRGKNGTTADGNDSTTLTSDRCATISDVSYDSRRLHWRDQRQRADRTQSRDDGSSTKEMGTVVLSIVRAASMPTSEKTEPRVETSKDDVKYSGVDAGISRFGRKNVPAGSIARENDNDGWYRRGELNNDRVRPDGDRATLSTNATSRLHPRVVDLIVGLDSAERATAVRDACYANGTMLRTILGNIGFHGSSLVGENTNISGVRSWHKVDVKTYIATNADKRYTIIFEYSTEEKITTYRMRRLLTVFAKHKSPGFVEWLGGARGWRLDDCHDTATEGGGGASSSWKRCAVIKLNTLQEVFKLFAKDAQKYMFDNSQRMVWRKQNELTDVVNDIRVWIETITPQCELTRKLLRNSSTGPDCLVHWAHHDPKSFHPLTVVTESSMLELVEGLIELFQKEFHHSESDPLGTRWRNHEKRRSTDFDLANRHCPAWTTDYLERRLNGDDSIKKTNFSCS
ncbi:hypothetical protein ACHAXA_002431 [Cyclostephanos tholiformis]|uniref:Uncharacterized protein n=1 Tax=Cyclostephanos tholiformis TaxID=382380 RepID=A0ABD3R165_9STRA